MAVCCLGNNMGVEHEEASQKMAMAMGATASRSCDACGARRARWFCPADGAYLCHVCDNSVHTANSVACRHNRVRLTRSAVRHGGLSMADGETSWPRKKTRSERRNNNITLVPSLQSTESGCTGSSKQNPGEVATTGGDSQLFLNSDPELFRLQVEDLNLTSFMSPGSHGDDSQHLDMYNNDNCEGSNPMGDGEATAAAAFSWLFDRVKVEESEAGGVEADIAGPEELFDLNIDLFDLTANYEEGEHDVKVENCCSNDEERKIFLSLNYEDVLRAWSGRGSPWADQNNLHHHDDDISTERTRGIEYGVVPDLNLRSGSCDDQNEEVPVMAGQDCDRERKYKLCVSREARVMRYREKRQSRLFFKRIRYHVRKLNAEKRPRMKGRFVKTAGDVLSERTCRRK